MNWKPDKKILVPLSVLVMNFAEITMSLYLAALGRKGR